MSAAMYRAKQAVILGLLSKHGPMTGRDLVEASGGALSRGPVYVVLDLMEEDGLVASEPLHEPGLPRRRYRITDAGWRAACDKAAGCPRLTAKESVAF